MSHPPTPDVAAEVALLRRQLERERRARRTAEQVGEQSTTQLYDTVQRLQDTQDQLRQHLEDQTLINQISLNLRQDLDSRGIVRRAVSSIGAAVGADRCVIRFADESRIGEVIEQWTGPVATPLDPGRSMPPALVELSLAAAQRRESLVIDDVRADPRIPPAEAAAVMEQLGSDSYLGTPMWMGNQLVGWLVLKSTTGARPWTTRQVAVVEGVADVLGIALMQAQAYARQSEALDRLRRVDQAKTEFVSTVSHELRTPLTSMGAYVELLLDGDVGPLNDDQHHMLGVISRSADRLTNVVEDLLALSRADAGVATVTSEAVDLRQVLENVQRTVAPLAVRRGVEVRLDCEAPAPTASGNPEHLERAVLNVMTNALKFTSEGGLVTASLTSDRAGAVLRVSDDGLGISKQDLPHVFERFYRGAIADEHAIQGTGLGLAVVKSTVEQHGGEVAIVSAPGHGTTVTISLPATRAEEDPAGDVDVHEASFPVPRPSHAHDRGAGRGTSLTG